MASKPNYSRWPISTQFPVKKIVWISFLPHTSRISLLSNRRWINDQNNIWWAEQNINVFIIRYFFIFALLLLPCVKITDSIHGFMQIPIAARLLGMWVRVPLGPWMSVFCECRVLSGLGLCVRTITHPEEPYRVCCVWVWSRKVNKEEA